MLTELLEWMEKERGLRFELASVAQNEKSGNLLLNGERIMFDTPEAILVFLQRLKNTELARG